ncbi:unnamed protein product [Tilletia controversa]|uniref:Uncharacterized protein n=3 Tax=Tilletia TaxID=13289 RepID=A0A8X7MYK4_9BASI|nr:hypothetical protein CF336_g1108 [Tilletia laevis]KAE8204519.1 hypothetical protein CF328_g1043 [Tilletia controversa]KAE8264793.1 hypothetical protein A4X03_0g703 [Tilletia caries]KAE8208142.1 hypothetical protein CF335_g630 [Tilletia laevis]KAE8253547.1 hypothetical protein A4X06_0g1373 [Tilletia controversa]
MAANLTQEERTRQRVHYWTSGVAVKHDGALLDGAWMALLVMTAGFLILMSTYTSRRQAIFWLQLVGIAVSTVVLVAHFEMNRRFLVLNIAAFAAGLPAQAPGATLEWSLAFNLCSLISTWITDIVLPLKVLTFYPRMLWPSLVRRLAIVAVPIVLLVARAVLIGFQAQSTWAQYQTDVQVFNFCNFITPVDALFQAIGNGFCAVLIIYNTRRLMKNTGVTSGTEDRLRFLLQATLVSFAPAVVVQILLVIVGFLDTYMADRYYNDSILDRVIYQRWEDVYNDIGILNNVLTCVFAVIATTYAPIRIARRASSTRSPVPSQLRHSESPTPVQHRTLFSNLAQNMVISQFDDDSGDPNSSGGRRPTHLQLPEDALRRRSTAHTDEKELTFSPKGNFFLTTKTIGSIRRSWEEERLRMRERKRTLSSQGQSMLAPLTPPMPQTLQFWRQPSSGTDAENEDATVVEKQ